jgi:hypothetical protein
MTYQDRLTSSGPARDDPEFGDPVNPMERPTGAGATSEGTAYDTGDTGSGDQSATDRAKDAAATGKEQAQNVAGTATDQAKAVASTATDEARNVAQTAQGQAKRLAGEARTELRTQADTQVNRLADGIEQLSRQLRSMGQGSEQGVATDLAGEAAERTQQVADRLRQGGVDDAVSQLRSFGRNKPGLFLLGAFGVGIAAGRLVRNLAQDPTEGSDSGYGSGYSGAPAAGSYGDYTTPSVPTGGTYAERYEVPAEAAGTPVPGAYADDAAQQAYGAPVPVVDPATPVAPIPEPPAYAPAPESTDTYGSVPPGTAPVSDERWGS